MLSKFVIYDFDSIYDNIILKDCFYKSGIELVKQYKNELSESLSRITNKYARDASMIEEKWFPSVDCHVFISHSHKDSKQIISFIGWLYSVFKIKAFADFTIWGFVDDLQQEIRDALIINDIEGLLSENEIANIAHSNAFTILNSALEKMIDKTECFLFIGTKNSLEGIYTRSPWIYSENLFSKMVKRKQLFEYRSTLVGDSSLQESFSIKYKVNFSDFVTLDSKDLMEMWKGRGVYNPIESLDYLYKIKGIIK